MKKNYFIKSAFVFLSLSVLLMVFSGGDYNPDSLLAGVFFKDSVTTKDLKSRYQLANTGMSKIRILVVPGHDENGGTSFRGVREADLNLELALNLSKELKKEHCFEVVLLRNASGYNPDFSNYLNNLDKKIYDFQKGHKENMSDLVDKGLVDMVNGVDHNTATSETVNTLYGINKWANDMEMDIVVHIHFNDYAGRPKDYLGEYSGFSIYIPEKQYSNAKASRYLAESVSNSLSKLFATSNHPKENREKGVVEDQELIAIGSFNTLDPIGLLIEYGYIYESQFYNSSVRDIVFDELATQTYLGIKNYFDNQNVQYSGVLPYRWEKDLKKGTKYNPDILHCRLNWLVWDYILLNI